MVNFAQPGQTIAEETDEANDEANVETNDDSTECIGFVDLEQEVAKPAINNTDQSVVNIERTIEHTRQSANNNKECNTTKSKNKPEQSDICMDQSVPSSKPSPYDAKHSYRGAESIVFRIRTVESDFTGRLSELKWLNDYFQQSEPPTPRICVVTGMDGIGKTQLVSKFIVENRSSYQNVIWIDAESSQSMNDSFKRLAKHINATGGDTKSVVQKRFCGKNTLFVYDNVVTSESIEFVFNETVEGSHVIITSLAENWNSFGNIKVIRLKEWVHIDAVEFVSKKLNDSEDTNADIEKLVEKLKFVPLALRLATAYIMWQRAISDSGCFEISRYLHAINSQGPIDDHGKTVFLTSAIAYQTIQQTQTRGTLATEILNIMAYFAPNDIERNFFVHLSSLKDSSQTDKMAKVAAASRLLVNQGMVTFDKEDTQQHLNIHRSIQEILKSKLLQSAGEEPLLDQALKLILELGTTVETVETVVPHAVHVFQSAKKYPSLVNKWSTLPAIILLKLIKEYPHYIISPSSEQLRECIQRNEYLQGQLHNLAEEDSDTVTVLAVLALQYLSNEVDSSFWMSWKFGVPLVVTGGVVAIAIGTTVIRQYVEQATERAVTKVINKAAEATEAAVTKAIDETNQKWIGYVASAAATVAVAAIGVVTGVNLA